MRPAEHVQVGANRNGSKIAEAVDMRVGRERRQRAPGQGVRVEEVRRGDRRVLREDAEEVREGLRVTVAKRNQVLGGEKDTPGLAGCLEPTLMRIRNEREHQGSDVIGEARQKGRGFRRRGCSRGRRPHHFESRNGRTSALCGHNAPINLAPSKILAYPRRTAHDSRRNEAPIVGARTAEAPDFSPFFLRRPMLNSDGGGRRR